VFGYTRAPKTIQPTTNFSNGVVTYQHVGGYRYRPELSTDEVAVFVLPAQDYHRTLQILMYTKFTDGVLGLPVPATLNVRECCLLGSWRRRIRTALIHERYQPALQVA
jgi:hypothetical protein